MTDGIKRWAYNGGILGGLAFGGYAASEIIKDDKGWEQRGTLMGLTLACAAGGLLVGAASYLISTACKQVRQEMAQQNQDAEQGFHVTRITPHQTTDIFR